MSKARIIGGNYTTVCGFSVDIFLPFEERARHGVREGSIVSARGLVEAAGQGALAGVKKGLQGFLWMLRILVPVSLATSVLAWSGFLETVSSFLAPAMGVLHLPGMAALPLVIGSATGIYGGLAAMASLPLTPGQATLVAVFLLMAHNLVLEGIVQGQSGINGLLVTVFRLGSAAVTTFVCGFFLGRQPGAAAATALAAAGSTARLPFVRFLGDWALSTGLLAGKILLIIMALLVVLEILKSLGWIRAVVRAMRPVLRILGLGEKTGYMWTAAAIFGLTYCAPLIVEEARTGGLSRRDLVKLHLSISINHSVIEDPLLFMATGIGAFWLFVPRLVFAILAVRVLSLWGFSARGRGASKNLLQPRRGTPPA
jgi:hypothetical protein